MSQLRFHPRQQAIWARGVLAVCWLTGVAAATARLSADEIETDPLVALIHRLEDQAAAAGSARCEFTVTYLPTEPAAREIIRAANQYRARALDLHVLEADEARRVSYRSVWERQGAVRREARTYANGRTERVSFGWDAAAPTGAYLIQPYSFVFEYRGWPLADWIRYARHRELARGSVNGQQRMQVSLVAGTEGAPLIILTFDELERLITREIHLDDRNYLIEHTRQKPMLHARHEFSEHRAYQDAGRNKTWIPSKALLRYYIGETSDGTPVEEYAIRVEIQKIELGVELLDEDLKKVPAARSVRVKWPAPLY